MYKSSSDTKSSIDRSSEALIDGLLEDEIAESVSLSPNSSSDDSSVDDSELDASISSSISMFTPASALGLRVSSEPILALVASHDSVQPEALRLQ